jgi:hypothetical protein
METTTVSGTTRVKRRFVDGNVSFRFRGSTLG